MKTGVTTMALKQGTGAWLAWRRGGIGASDAPAIMGENPWKTPDQVLGEKLGVTKTSNSSAMDRGSTLEPEARQQYEIAQFFGIPEEEVKQFLGPAPGDAETWWPESTWFFSETRLDELVRLLSKGRQK